MRLKVYHRQNVVTGLKQQHDIPLWRLKEFPGSMPYMPYNVACEMTNEWNRLASRSKSDWRYWVQSDEAHTE